MYVVVWEKMKCKKVIMGNANLKGDKMADEFQRSAMGTDENGRNGRRKRD